VKYNSEDNITPFKGNRKAPTPDDWKQLEDFAQELVDLVKAREISCVAWVATFTDKPTRTIADWLILPGVEGHVLNSALSIQQRDFEMGLWTVRPTDEETD
jgi:hypothetical protein